MDVGEAAGAPLRRRCLPLQEGVGNPPLNQEEGWDVAFRALSHDQSVGRKAGMFILPPHFRNFNVSLPNLLVLRLFWHL